MTQPDTADTDTDAADTASTETASTDTASPADPDRNDVALRGVLSAPVEVRELPSGDPLLVFRLTVRRAAPTARPRRPREPRQDTITCVSYGKALINRSVAWHPGDALEVEGSLRRRVWRTPTGTAVAHEVDCRRVRKVRLPVARPTAAAGPA